MLKKLGVFLLDWLLASLWPKVLSAVKEYYDKIKRDKEQKEAKDKLEDDVVKEKPRDAETRKNEEDFLNS